MKDFVLNIDTVKLFKQFKRQSNVVFASLHL